MASVFKIRSKKTGLFSTGGGRPSFSKKGKQWAGLGPVKNHIHCLDSHGKSIYNREEAELVEYEIIQYEVSVKPFSDFCQEVVRALADKEAERQQRFEESQKEIRRQQFLKLQSEFGNQ